MTGGDGFATAAPVTKTVVTCKIAHFTKQNICKNALALLLGPPVAITQPTWPLYVLLLFLSFFLQREISAVSRPIAAKLCHMIGNGCSLKKLGPKFGGPPPKKEIGG